jgi:hypothetical protein
VQKRGLNTVKLCRILGSGHVPSEERDVFGRPTTCARCGTTEAEMSKLQRERFFGKALLQDTTKKVRDWESNIERGEGPFR